ncbi:uncharacterized protein B0T23DRAFT_6625 [Neurospora hispaniola]|uniref:Uncharacterized protein n=1 Tax=Neurospora hispaniola TaxID=588809 RepID=A0AAJ0IEQ8_9PEZI|nr:hypothetical protein B0T23DRAFT_6625 [Neurospora hispaniola]
MDIYNKPTTDLQLFLKSKATTCSSSPITKNRLNTKTHMYRPNTANTTKTTTTKYTPYYDPWSNVKPLPLYNQAKRDQDMDNNYRLALTSTRDQESWWRKLLRNVICLPLMLLSGYIILGIMFGVAVYTVGCEIFP